MRRTSVLALLALAATMGGPQADAGAAGSTARDWTRFGFDAQRSGVGPARTGIAARDIRGLRRRRVKLPGTVDSSPIYLARVTVAGKRRRGVFFVTTSYGITLAIDARTGRMLWKYVPGDIRRWQGGPQITETSPVADPSRQAIYAASPDGLIHKLSVADGSELAGWPVPVTLDAKAEKLGSALNISGRYLLVAVGSYLAKPRYQGHVLTIDRASGRIAHVFNSLCSYRQDQIFHPATCASSSSGIWSRAGAVVIPGSRRLLVATGNGPFNGFTDWADSVLMLAPDASRLLQNYTPVDQAQLELNDDDVGSTSPALLPLPGRGRARYRYAVQGGKDFKAKLLGLDRLNGATNTPGPRTGGELQVFGGSWTYTQPAVWRSGGRVFLFAADGGDTTAYEFRGRRPRLRVLWRNGTAGTSPVLAGGLLYVYERYRGGVNVYRPLSGRKVGKLASGPGHWNSPIVVDGRVALGEGDANRHRASGVLNIWSR